MNSRPTSINVPFGNVGNESGQRFAVLMKRIRFMRSNPSADCRSRGRKKPPSFASRLRTAKPVFALKTRLIFGDEPLEMMKKHPVEDGPLRMPRAIDSRHGGNKASRNGPLSRMGPRPPEKRR